MDISCPTTCPPDPPPAPPDRLLAVVDWSRRHGADAPAVAGDLRHDAAEAILIGLWGVLHHGLLEAREAP